MRLVKDGKIYLDGTLREYEKEKMAFDKLEEIENIEELIHLDVTIFFKALRHGIHVLDDGIPYDETCLDLIYAHALPIGFEGKVSNHVVFFEDYGKTWSLKRDKII